VDVLDSNKIEIAFSETVIGAGESKNYQISPSLDSIYISNQDENRFYLVTKQVQNPRLIYQLTVSNITDSAGNFLASDQLSFAGYGGLSKQLKLKLIKGSLSSFGQGWRKAIDGKIHGWEGTARVKGNPCHAIFAFSDQQIHAIYKVRLLTDSGIRAADHWVKEFTVEISTTDVKSQSFFQVLEEEKKGGNWEEFPIDTLHARFIKLTLNQPSQDWCQLAEFQAWGQDTREGLAIKKNSHIPIDSTTDNKMDGDERLADQVSFSNFPNPFNQRTHITFQLPISSHVRLSVFNIIGEEIITLLNGWKPEGRYQVCWDGKDDAGLSVPSGIYIIRMSGGGVYRSRKLILMK